MVRICLTEQQLRVRRQVDSRRLRQKAWVFADEIFIGVSLRATTTLTFLEGESGLGEARELCWIQFHRAVLRHALHQFVRNVIQNENLFLTDAEQIVVERRARNDRLGRARRAAGVVHKHRWIARASADGALAGLHRRLHDHRSAGDKQQAGEFVFAKRVEGIERRFLDDARDVLDAGLTINRFVVGADRHRCTSRCARVRVEHDGVPRRNNVHDVSAQCGN